MKVPQKWFQMIVMTFFFFKQKTAYEMSASLVGSEMCIRDRFVIDIHQNMSFESFGTTFEALSKLTFWRLK